MRIIKWIAAGCAVVFIVVIIVAYVVVSGYDLNKLKPEISKAVMERTGRELVIKGDMDIKFGLSPILTVSDVKFQGAPWSTEPYMATIEAIELKLKLLPLIFKRLEVRRFVVSTPVIFVETDSKGRSNLDFTQKKAKKIKTASAESEKVSKDETGGAITLPRASLPKVSLDDLRIKGGRFSFKDGQTGKEYAIELKELKAKVPAMDMPMTLTLDGSFKDKPFGLDGTFGSIEGLLSKVALWPVKARASFDTIKVELDGTAMDILGERIVDMAFLVKGKELSELEILTGSDVPLSGPFEFNGRVEALKAHTYKLTDFTGRLGGSDISGVVTAVVARSKGRPPKVDARLRSDKLDLRPLLKKGGASGEGASAPKSVTKKRRKKVFSKEPLGFELLKLVDGDIDFKAGEVLLEKLAFTDLSVGIKLNGGKANITPLKGKVGGGEVSGALLVDAAGAKDAKPVVAVKFKGDKIDVGRMLKDLGVTANYKGKIDVDIDVRGNGRSVAEIMATLNGRAYVSAGKGSIKSRYANILDGDILTALLSSNTSGEEVELEADPDNDVKTVKINCLVLGFTASGGVADTTAFLFDTDKASVQAKGRVKLYNEHINMTFDLVPKDSLGAGGVGIGLSELVKPLKIKGTLARPKVKVDSSKALTTLLKGLGGAALLGPPGAVLALAGNRHVEGENACVAAIEKAKKDKDDKRTTTTKPKPKPASSPTEKTIEDIGKELEKGFKSLFGR